MTSPEGNSERRKLYILVTLMTLFLAFWTGLYIFTLSWAPQITELSLHASVDCDRQNHKLVQFWSKYNNTIVFAVSILWRTLLEIVQDGINFFVISRDTINECPRMTRAPREEVTSEITWRSAHSQSRNMFQPMTFRSTNPFAQWHKLAWAEDQWPFIPYTHICWS